MPGNPKDAWKNNRSRPAAPGHGKESGSGLKWFGAAVVLAALGGAAVGLFVYLRPEPEPVLLAIPITQYTHPDWPPNPWAEADARGLRDLFAADSAQAFQFQEKARVLQQLGRAADDSRASPRRPLVVCLCALAATTPDGTVHLVPGDAKPDDPTSWVPLADVLQPLRRTPAPRLLVLDLRPAAGPRSVFASGDVNEALDAELDRLDKAGDLPFLVLSANTPPDGPNVFRPLQRSVFGLSLAQGAGGHADGWNERRSRDGQVSARELAVYVREVSYRASAAGGFAPQLPRLHGSGPDFTFRLVPRAGSTPLPAPGDAAAYPDWLLAGWKDRDVWVSAGLHRRAPRLVRHMTADAIRTERRWLAGADPKALAEQFEPVVGELRAAAKGITPLAPPAMSVARSRGRTPDAERATETALRPLLDKLRDPAGAKPDELAAARQAAWARPPDPPGVTAGVLFNFALGIEEPTHDQMKQLATAAEGFRLPPSVELLTVSLIAGLEPPHARRWPPGTIRRLLLLARDAEEAAACDGRCLPWVRGELGKADETRRQALAILCNPKSPDDRNRQAVGQLDDAAAGYAAVKRSAAGLGAAWLEYEEARAVLADFATAYPDNLTPDPEAVGRAWVGLVEDFRRLQAQLHPAAAPGLPELDQLTRLVTGVRSWRLRLRGLVKLPDEPGVRDLEAALVWPWLTQAERVDLVGKLERANRAATDRALGAWPGSPSGQEPGAPPKGSAAVGRASVRDLRRLADWLTLSDGKDAEADAKAAAALRPDPVDANALADLARKVRATWRVKLPDAYRAADATRRAAIGWAVDTDDIPAVSRPGVKHPPNPEPPDRAGREKEFHRWLAESRYRPDAKAVRDLMLGAKEARTYADGLDAVASEYAGWTP